MFKIILTTSAKKYISKLEDKDKHRIISGLERIQIRPHNHVKKLISSPYFRLRIRKYRVILDIQTGKLVILVIEIGHRKNIYKK